MLFDNRRQGNLSFKFGQTDILSADFHKHLGFAFSSDGKWTRHIDYILSKASKQVCVLRKLKFILKRIILEKTYLVFSRPLLEYSCEVWDNCSQTRTITTRSSTYCYWVNCVFEQGFFISKNGMEKIIKQTGTQKAMLNV